MSHRLPRLALRQIDRWRRRLHQLPVQRKTSTRRFVDALLQAEFYEPHIPEDKTPYFEGCLPIEEIARRGRDTLALRSYEAGGSGRSAHGQVGVRDCAASPGKPASRQLQPGRLPESYEVWRSGARVPNDSRIGECGISALRADAPQHLHQLACAAAVHVAIARANRAFFSRGRFLASKAMRNRSPRACWRGVMRHALRKWRPADTFPRETALGSLCHYISHAEPRHVSAGEYHVRSAAGVGRCSRASAAR